LNAVLLTITDSTIMLPAAPVKAKQTVPEAHSELLHYTTVAGLSGILESQSLRATHAAYLNDSTEIQLFFRERLAKVLEAGIRAELAHDPQARTPQEADAIVLRYAAELAEATRETSQRFNQPHFVCFSAPASPRIARDGLLSQWRGYSKDGGYALVFDAAALEDCIKLEATTFWYQFMRLGRVHYHQDDDDLVHAAPEILDSEESLRCAVRAYIQNRSAAALESTFVPVTTLSCLYKHWGFHEEREVRIVAIPPTEERVREGREGGESRPVRETKTFARNGTPVPYLDLFARKPGPPTTAHEGLPIKRVLVGPHPQSEIRCFAVQEMLRVLGIPAQVEVSRIPFVGS
jgi:hypothetical protein